MMASSEPVSALEEYQQTLRSGEAETTDFGSPEHGTVVELLMCDHLDLDHNDGPYIDAWDNGRATQIKACQVEHSNGGDDTVPGRWDAWSEGLIHLLADDGQYLLVVYDGDTDPADVDADDIGDYIRAWRFVDADEFGRVIEDDAWHDGNRASKGQRARVFWTEFFEGTEVEP